MARADIISNVTNLFVILWFVVIQVFVLSSSYLCIYVSSYTFLVMYVYLNQLLSFLRIPLIIFQWNEMLFWSLWKLENGIWYLVHLSINIVVCTFSMVFKYFLKPVWSTSWSSACSGVVRIFIVSFQYLLFPSGLYESFGIFPSSTIFQYLFYFSSSNFQHFLCN